MKSLNKYLMQNIKISQSENILERLKINKDTKLPNIKPEIDDIYVLCKLIFHKIIQLKENDGYSNLIDDDWKSIVKNIAIDEEYVNLMFDICVYDGNITQKQLDKILKDTVRKIGKEILFTNLEYFIYESIKSVDNNQDSDKDFEELYMKNMYKYI